MSEVGLRMMGKDPSGKAKALITDNDGNQRVRTAGSIERKVYNNIEIPANGEVVAITDEAKGYSFVRLSATGLTSEVSGLEFYFSTADTLSNLFNENRSYILEDRMENLGTARNIRTRDFPLHGRFFGIKIKNTSGSLRKPHSITVSLISDGVLSPLPERQKVEVSGSVIEAFLYDATTTTMTTRDVKGANTLVLHIDKDEEGTNRGIYLEGVVENTNDIVRIPLIDSNRILRPNVVIRKGLYYANVAGLKQVRVLRYTSSTIAKVSCVLTTAPCPEPLDTAVRYRRITANDGQVSGQFRAIEPLTDIQLSSVTRFSINDPTDSDRQIFVDGDTLLAGQTLFGNFDRVQLISGVALLVIT